MFLLHVSVPRLSPLLAIDVVMFRREEELSGVREVKYMDKLQRHRSDKRMGQGSTQGHLVLFANC